jgi:TatD DNase family protein
MRQYGVQSVQIGCRVESARLSIALAEKYPDLLWASVGYHPCDSQDEEGDIDSIYSELESMIRDHPSAVVAVGECGLDYHYLDSTTDEKKGEQIRKQKESFVLQWELAKKYDLPLIIHSRDARDDTLAMIHEYGMTRLIMHCFSEDIEFASDLIAFSADIYFSFSGTVTYKNAPKIQEAASKIPLNRILIETDSPFLAPIPVRGTVNEPANVRYVLDKICELRGESREEIESALYANALRVYGIQKSL